MSRHHQWDFNALAAKPFVATGSGPAHLGPVAILGRVRKPASWHQSNDGMMPDLFGDDDENSRLTLTPTQYHILRQWSLGKFDNSTWTWPLPALVPTFTAQGLDRAALGSCAGGAFYPGIELGWIIREARLYSSPISFRFQHPTTPADPLGIAAGSDPGAVYPGDLTKRMACPWQADFHDCAGKWWPAQRPDQAVVALAPTRTYKEWARNLNQVGGLPVSGHMGMVVHWSELGVVTPEKDATGQVVQVERDRTLPEPP